MYNETMVTLQGYVGGDLTVRQAGGATVANFRLACTPRRRAKDGDGWVDGPTQWYSVSAWRWLAEHCAESLHRGDAVLVHGRLDHRTYVNKSGVEVLDLCVEATVVGHDLSRGTSSFQRAQAPAAAPAPQAEASAA